MIVLGKALNRRGVSLAIDNKKLIQAWGVVLRAFELEQTKGYVNTAVLGGLDQLIANYADELRAIDKELNETDFQYALLLHEDRERWIDRWLRSVKDAIETKNKQATRAALEETTEGERSTIDDLAVSISKLSSVTSRRVSGFEKLEIYTVKELLYHFPRKYAEICPVGQLRPSDEENAIVVQLRDITVTVSGKMKKSTEAMAYDSSGTIRVLWFNQSYLAKTLRRQSRVMLRGKVSVYRNGLVLESPEIDVVPLDFSSHPGNSAVAIYGATAGLTQAAIRSAVRDGLGIAERALLETLPLALRDKLGLVSIQRAIKNIHLPASAHDLEQARRRLQHEEMTIFQLRMQLRRRAWRNQEKSSPAVLPSNMLRQFVEALPFGLTGSQKEGIEEILGDIATDVPMSRLLHGEVGSGKTVVAVAAMLAVTAIGKTSLMMAPTEILAEQHFQTIARLLRGEFGEKVEVNRYLSEIEAEWFPRKMRIALLTGGVPFKQKKIILEQLAEGEIDIVVGTHALIQEGVHIPSLALAIVDEQHRFGVLQRQHVREMTVEARPHLLVMSATPIPRTLRLAHYGDLDISTLTELPGDRKPIKTSWARPGQRELAYGFLRKQVLVGRQGFIICPLVEGSDVIQARSAVEEYERLGKGVYPDLKLGLLHGRMKPREKLDAMEEFRAGRIDILLTTSVVEVGVDVPNATVVIIDGADRFGMAQLHQFRGRVGRGEHQGYCILLSDNPSSAGQERLEIVEAVKDGFALAEEDLRIRGEGDLLGTVQSGIMEFKLADFNDIDTVLRCRDAVKELLDADPNLNQPENSSLIQSLQLDLLDP